MDMYSEFGPAVHDLLELADEENVKVWTLLDMKRIPTWYKNKLVLMGDAAHPFLPRTSTLDVPYPEQGLTARGSRRPRPGWWYCH